MQTDVAGGCAPDDRARLFQSELFGGRLQPAEQGRCGEAQQMVKIQAYGLDPAKCNMILRPAP